MSVYTPLTVAPGIRKIKAKADCKILKTEKKWSIRLFQRLASLLFACSLWPHSFEISSVAS